MTIYGVETWIEVSFLNVGKLLERVSPTKKFVRLSL
jgi:hypothetical protein